MNLDIKLFYNYQNASLALDYTQYFTDKEKDKYANKNGIISGVPTLKYKSRNDIIINISSKTKIDIDEIKSKYFDEIENVYYCHFYKLINEIIATDIWRTLYKRGKLLKPINTNYRKFWNVGRMFIFDHDNYNIDLFLCPEIINKIYLKEKHSYLIGDVCITHPSYTSWGNTSKGNGLILIDKSYEINLIIISELLKLVEININFYENYINSKYEDIVCNKYKCNVFEASVNIFNEKIEENDNRY